MLQIVVKPLQDGELFDEKTQTFINIDKPVTLTLEHSLVSISKWEAIMHKPFISKERKTQSDIIEYTKCMTVTQNVDPMVYYVLAASKDNLVAIQKYIDDSMTATIFSNREPKGPSRNEMITSELIYYWMIDCGIPFECQKWHLNRLLTLIRICNIKNSPGKNMSKREILSSNAALNAYRKKKLHTTG